MSSQVFLIKKSLLVIWLAAAIVAARADEDKPFGLDQRIPWTTSRVVGSPEPPPPYTVERTFTNIVWKAPLYIAPEPGSDRLFVIQQGGDKDEPSEILWVRDDPDTTLTETIYEVTGRLIYGLTFHPGYNTNGFLFVFSNGPWGKDDRTNRVSRFTVSRQAPYRCDAASERIILEWKSAGHDGGDLAFGLDGMLYIASGDGTSDSDGWVSGQDVSNLLAALLRIDVDHPEDGRNYAVPQDNPFVRLPAARPEIWAYGFRNPWRMTVDRKKGHVWVGNNGQDLWETAYFVRRGENYGWSVYEGSHPFYLNRARGPTPIVKPTIEHHHSEFRSLTGGVVYYGERFPDLNGVYVYGDYSTGKIWGARHDGQRLTWQGELADTSLQIAGFGVDQREDLLIADITGGIYRLVRGPKDVPPPKFPARLSETGIFTSVKEHRVDPGLIPYSVIAPGWADGARSERYLGIPGDLKIAVKGSRSWELPDSTVVVQTLCLDLEAGHAGSARRVETRLLVRQQGEWTGYSYRWNDEQSDATLVEARGEEGTLSLKDSSAPGGFRKQVWRFPSRAECMVCHSRAANFVLGLTELQMSKERDYGGISDNQLRALDHIALFTPSLKKPAEQRSKLANPYDPSAELDARARSYLHVNCSVCHVGAGGGNAKMELEFTTRREKMELFGARPQHDTFGIDNAMLVAPGDPARSVLLQRLSRRGPGQMPPLVTTAIDHEAVRLFRDWIAQMKPDRAFVWDWTMEDLLASLEQAKAGRSFESGKAAFRDVGCVQCHRFAAEGGSVGPDLTSVHRRLGVREILESIILPSKTISEQYAATEIETEDGEIVAGRVEREDDRTISIRANPLAPDSLTIRKRDIKRRRLSSTSNMPTGIINVLEKNQILDLLAYLISDGSENDPAFQK
ncbi:MAG: PQQ-dependent sugar dehydrogenase [Verrucomicrobia bacterium]|nr:PQQ-dependent sugar dehydrogenase [Verrucomicrobiota bacterium]